MTPAIIGTWYRETTCCTHSLVPGYPALTLTIIAIWLKFSIPFITGIRPTGVPLRSAGKVRGIPALPMADITASFPDLYPRFT